MQVGTGMSLSDACAALSARLKECAEQNALGMWQQELSSFDEEQFLCSVTGTVRIAFKSRDRDLEFFGLGVSDKVFATSAQNDDTIEMVTAKLKKLSDEQLYFGAIRFDEHAEISSEWRGFGLKIFILPLVLVTVRAGRITLVVNYSADGDLPWSVWLDNAITLLAAIAAYQPKPRQKVFARESAYAPTTQKYFFNIDNALNNLSSDPHQQKVVIGRRRAIPLNELKDPAELFFRLRKKSGSAFLFFFDTGKDGAFFGGSPELLYRREYNHFATESIAGTRARSVDEVLDRELQEALFSSFKDNREHALVSMHIEEKLKDFGITDMFSSNLDVMVLSYVQHLVKRYRGTLRDDIDDATIIKALHPTPAVCGLSTPWSREFIRENEGFDRGLYAGPIGFVSKACAEFSVAIRSALFNDQTLYLYVAGGIVAGSIREQEWEELNNKEKNILSIFDTEI